jgi:signal peptidase I
VFGFADLLAQAVPQGGFIYWVDKVARTSLSTIVLFAAVLTFVRLALLPLLRNTPKHARGSGFGFARFVNETCDALIYASIVVFMLVRPFGIQTFHIPTGSMLQTLYEKDFIVANKAIYRYTDPKVGDIVVFHPPDTAFGPGEPQTDFIKRCVGVPGDVIEMKDLKLYRNGKPVEEPYVWLHSMQDFDTGAYLPLPKDQWPALAENFPDFKLVEVDGRVVPLLYKGTSANYGTFATVPEFRDPGDDAWIDLPAAPIPDGYYMFMGDHRNGSSDSRVWGLVPRENIIGRSEFIILPFSRIGRSR